MDKNIAEIIRNMDSATLKEIMKLKESPEGAKLTEKIKNADKNELLKLVKAGINTNDPSYAKKLYDILEGK